MSEIWVSERSKDDATRLCGNSQYIKKYFVIMKIIVNGAQGPAPDE